LPDVGVAVDTHVWDGTIFPCELDAASSFVIGDQPRRYSGDSKLDVLFGQKITLDLGALRLVNPDIIGIAAD
jgi:hypothetical protein